MNSKNYQYYNNRNVYGNICIPRREEVLNYLIKNKFLSEFKTDEEKQQVLRNLGVLQEIDNLLNLIDTKLSNYVTSQYFLRKIDELKQKSKGYFSSIEALLQEYPRGEKGDWAIVNVDGTWYVYRYKAGTGWEQSEVYDNSIDLTEYQKLLIPGENIKTINGESILGEGNIEIVGGESENCATKEDVAQEILRAQTAEGTLSNRLDVLENGPYSVIIDGIKHVIIKKSQYNRLTEYEDNALYFVTKDWTFGEEFPVVFTDADWKFGEHFPIVFTDTIS